MVRFEFEIAHNELDGEGGLIEKLRGITFMVTSQGAGPFPGTGQRRGTGPAAVVGDTIDVFRGDQEYTARVPEGQGVLWRGASGMVLNRMLQAAQKHLRGAFPPRPVDQYGQMPGQPAKGPYPRMGGNGYKGWYRTFRVSDPTEAQITTERGRLAGLVARATVESEHADIIMKGRKPFIAVNTPFIAADSGRRSWMVFRGKDGKPRFIPVAPGAVHSRVEAKKRKPSRKPTLAESFYVRQSGLGPNPTWLRAAAALRTELDLLADRAERDLREDVRRVLERRLGARQG